MSRGNDDLERHGDHSSPDNTGYLCLKPIPANYRRESERPSAPGDRVPLLQRKFGSRRLQLVRFCGSVLKSCSDVRNTTLRD